VESTSSYVIFPGSDKFLFILATGSLRFTNNNRVPLVLRSHRRGCTRNEHVIGGIFTLAPFTKQAFDFRGWWCVEVVSGDCAGVTVAELETSGGGKGNFLGMA